MRAIKIDNYNDVIINVHCRAFSCEGVKNNRVAVDAEGKIWVWDSISKSFVDSHSIGPMMQGKIRATAARFRDEAK